MAAISERRLRPDWTSKTLAGLFAGFFIALGLAGIFAWAGPGGLDAANKVQFNMWLITPLWMLIWSLVYLFRSGLHAWAVLGCSALMIQAVLWLLRSGGLGG